MIKHYNIELNGTMLSVKSYGDGFPIILIHGFPDNSNSWKYLIPLLSDRFRVITLDLRGIGESAICPQGHDKKNLAKDIKGILDDLHIDTAVIVGKDMGGLVAQRFALDYTNTTKALICISTVHIGHVPLSFFYRFKQLKHSWYIFFFNVPIIPDVLMPFFAKSLVKNTLGGSRNPYQMQKIHELQPEILKQFSRERLPASLDLYRSLKVDLKINKLDNHIPFKMPTLWLRGSDDLLIPSFEDNHLQRFLNLETKLFEQEGHWLVELCPEKVAESMMLFLKKIVDKQ